METIIDTVEACTLEVGDITDWGVIETVIDNGDVVTLFFEDDDADIVTVNALSLVDLFGYVYTESV